MACKGSCVPVGQLQMDFACVWTYRTPPFLLPSFLLKSPPGFILSFFATISGPGGSYSLPRLRLEDSTLHPESQIIFHSHKKLSEETIIQQKKRLEIQKNNLHIPIFSSSHISTRDVQRQEKDTDNYGLILTSSQLLKRKKHRYFCLHTLYADKDFCGNYVQM